VAADAVVAGETDRRVVSLGGEVDALLLAGAALLGSLAYERHDGKGGWRRMDPTGAK
jgi:hypothetical protein